MDAQPAPNIVLIMADDMGFSDLGCMGSEIRTPNIDSIASAGVHMTQVYNNARCCPSRASLLTGLYPHQAGIGHMMADLGHPSYRGFLNENCITIAEGLREAGYATYMAGKWHVGGQYAPDKREEWAPGAYGFPRPIDRGFDEHFGTLGGSGSYFRPHGLVHNDSLIDDPGPNFYYTDAIANASVDMIRSGVASGNPFFLFSSHVAPHWPLHAYEEDVEPYRGAYRDGWDTTRLKRFERMVEYGLINADWKLSPRDPFAPPWEDVAHTDWEDARMATYAAQVTRMDKGVGKLLAALDELGVRDNTVVMFVSDNGGCAELLQEDGVLEQFLPTTRDGRPVRAGNDPSIMPGPDDTFMSYDLPWANVSNTPFRLYKHWVHEGGISSPCLVQWPREIAPGAIEDSPVHFVDILPTFLDMAGASYPSSVEGVPIHPCEGESFRPLLAGDEWSRSRPIFWEHEGNRAIRRGRWKLVCRFPGEWELYDIEADRTELEDLSEQLPEVVESLREAYDDWARRTDVLPWDTVRGWLTQRGLALWEEQKEGAWK